jgi:hypothetical protein
MQFQIPCPCCLRYTSTPVPAVPETETYQTTTLKHQVLLLRHFTSNPPWHKNLSLGHFQCAHLPRIAVVTPALWDFRPRMTQIRVVTWILASHVNGDECIHIYMPLTLVLLKSDCSRMFSLCLVTVSEEIAVQRSVSPFLSIVSPHSSPSTGSLRSCHG